MTRISENSQRREEYKFMNIPLDIVSYETLMVMLLSVGTPLQEGSVALILGDTRHNLT